MSRIGVTIKNLRLEKGYTQQDLAYYLYVSPQAISKWEREMNDPDINLLPKIATYFGVSIDHLFNFNQEGDDP